MTKNKIWEIIYVVLSAAVIIGVILFFSSCIHDSESKIYQRGYNDGYESGYDDGRENYSLEDAIERLQDNGYKVFYSK